MKVQKYFLVLIVVMWCVPSFGFWSNTEEERQSSVLKLSESRTLAEDLVKKAKRNPLSDLDTIETKYNRARAKANAIIDFVEVSLISGKFRKSDLSEHIEQLEISLVELHEAASNELGWMGIDVQKVVSGVIDGLVDAAVMVWKSTKDDDTKKRKEMKEFFDTLRWKEWDDIEMDKKRKKD